MNWCLRLHHARHVRGRLTSWEVAQDTTVLWGYWGLVVMVLDLWGYKVNIFSVAFRMESAGTALQPKRLMWRSPSASSTPTVTSRLEVMERMQTAEGSTGAESYHCLVVSAWLPRTRLQMGQSWHLWTDHSSVEMREREVSQRQEVSWNVLSTHCIPGFMDEAPWNETLDGPWAKSRSWPPPPLWRSGTAPRMAGAGNMSPGQDTLNICAWASASHLCTCTLPSAAQTARKQAFRC